MSNKVKSRMRTGENCFDREGVCGDSHCSQHGFSDAACSDHKEDATSSGASTPRGDVHPSAFGVFSPFDEKSPVKTSRDSGDESEGKPAIQKLITLMGKKGISWPWKGNDREASEARTTRFVGLGWEMIKRVKHFNKRAHFLVQKLKSMLMKVIDLSILRQQVPGHPLLMLTAQAVSAVVGVPAVVLLIKLIWTLIV